MVTEKPPRRSKSRQQSTTIDLTAKKNSEIADPVRSDDSDNKTLASVQTPPGKEKTAEDLLSSSSPPVDETPAKAADKKLEKGASDTDKTLQSPDDKKAETSPPATQTTVNKETAVSTLIAAGIFGGIVALTLAGSMHYAGYLPLVTDTRDATDEIPALRQEIEALRQNSATDADLADRINAIETTLSRPQPDDVGERLSAVEQQLAAVHAAVEKSLSESDGLLEQFQGRLNVVETKLNEPREDIAAARAVTAAALKAAIDRGGSFNTELATYAEISPDNPTLAKLQTFSNSGVPSREQLAEQFQGVADAILNIASQPDPDLGIADRLLSSALSVVKVRRIGDVEGDTPEAIVTRLENELKNGHLQAAATEWESLPEEARIASRDFKQALDARIAVDGLIAETLARAVNETGTRN